ncbi:hypothetical protein L7F22_023705 [Adiantum nelumboides]|nr:hypothetical protein [Adiantum nelumboides]
MAAQPTHAAFYHAGGGIQALLKVTPKDGSFPIVVHSAHKPGNKVISNSSLWMNHCFECKKHWLQLSSKTLATRKSNILEDQIPELADWKACYVKVQRKTLLMFGSVLVKERRGHSKRVECCRVKMDTIVTGSSDGVVHAWSSTTLECLATYIVSNKGRVVDLEFDENKILAIAATEIYVWNREKGSLLRHIHGHNQSLHSMFYVDPKVVVGCSDGTIRVFDIYSGQCGRILRQHADRVTCIVVDVSSSVLMSGSADGTVELCDYITSQKICCLLPSSPPQEVHCLHLLSCQSILMGCTSRGCVYAWDIRKHKLLWTVRVGPSSVTSLHSPSYDASTLVTGDINGVITILDTSSGAVVRRLAVAHTKQDSLDKSKRSSVAAELARADISLPSKGIPSNIRSPILCLKAGMTRIVTSHPDGMIRIWQFSL